MDEGSLKLAKGLVTSRYVDAASDALRHRDSTIRSVLAQRRLPEEGLSDVIIQHLLYTLSLMDSNNFPSRCGAGEREGRVLSNLVRERHYHMSHGIGRSGDLTADQPKACGSSLIYKLTNCFVLEALRISGYRSCESAMVVPMATGMTLALVLQSVRRTRPVTAKYVIWPRIDQKTSLKCIESAGLTPWIVQLTRTESDFLCVAPSDVEAAIDTVGVENVVCVLSTTSCFAPRVPDDSLLIARLCSAKAIPLVVNNAYGVQSATIMKRLDAASHVGSLYAIVQSTDKNFLVPVGGAVVAGRKKHIAEISELYAGRASSSQALDVFMTLLGLGSQGFSRLVSTRTKLFSSFIEQASAFAARRGEELWKHPRNEISVAITMRSWGDDPTSLGAMLFRKGVTGPRIIIANEKKELCGTVFPSYGCHTDDMEHRPPLLVIACAIGMTLEEQSLLFDRLTDVWSARTEV